MLICKLIIIVLKSYPPVVHAATSHKQRHKDHPGSLYYFKRTGSMQLKQLPLIGSIIGIVGVIIALVVFIGVSVFIYKMFSRSAAQTNGLAVAGHDSQNTAVEADAVILEMRESGLIVKEYAEVELLLDVRPEHKPPFQVKITTAVYRLHTHWFRPGARLKITYNPNDLSNVDITSGPSPPPETGGKNAEDRLKQLEKLKNKGLVTEEEYQLKREEILRGL
jgi:hypothetical protein